jgi:hypothetical protein
MKKWSVEARQINYGYFQIEAESVEEAHKILAEMMEDDFIRETAEWELGEIELTNLS